MVKINNQNFGYEEFHNGEAIYKMVELHDRENTVKVQFEDNRDITNMLMAVEYIRDKKPEAALYLRMLYIPYSRTDREIPEGGQIFSMKYFANIINRVGFTRVIVMDPHSEVSKNLLENMVEIELSAYVNEAVKLFKPDYIIYPDKGAFEKYPSILEYVNVPYFHANKKRDLSNRGALIEDAYELVDAPDLTGKSVLIVDDLIALGGTAFLTGKTLKKAGAERVGLYISHTENGVFCGKLLDGDENGYRAVDIVYTAGTIPLKQKHERLVVLEV